MSNPNVALVNEMLRAYEQGDEEKLRSLIHPEAEIHAAPAIFGWLYQWEDGRARRFRVYPTLEEALEAARRLVAERV